MGDNNGETELTGDVAVEPEEELIARHRREKKDLQAKIQALKKTATKGDKKKKKDVAEEIAKIEKELTEKHEVELKELKESHAPVEVTELCEKLEEDLVVEKEIRVTKAQKRRDKKSNQERERENMIIEQEKANLHGARHTETEKIKKLLAAKTLTFYEVPSDGNCMYVAILHQLNKGDVCYTMQQLRKIAADYMRNNQDDIMPFMDEIENEAQFIKYCDDTERTPAWGGQLELRALSQVLRRRIEVVQAEGRVIIVGEEFIDPSLEPIVLTYHRHMYGLGEHYNSVQQLPPDVPEDPIL